MRRFGMVVFLLFCSCGEELADFGTIQSALLGNPDDPIAYSGGALTPGLSYYWNHSNVNWKLDTVYTAGDMPLIITIPHGGTLAPSDISNRTCGTNDTDDKADLLGRALEAALVTRTNGKHPHVVMANLKRTKIDQNRNYNEDCNPTSGRGGYAWQDFHTNWLWGVAVPAVRSTFGRGLYVDLHGKPDNYGAGIDIGYMLTSTNLAYSDASLNNESNSYINKSSVRWLYRYAQSIGMGVTFADIVRHNVAGRVSFGEVLQTEIADFNTLYGKDYRVVPRNDAESPSAFYLSGEFNVRKTCGTKYSSSYDYSGDYSATSFIAGFQVEVRRQIRMDDALRNAFADELAKALLTYLQNFYGWQP